jgi:hypothetical protein
LKYITGDIIIAMKDIYPDGIFNIKNGYYIVSSVYLASIYYKNMYPKKIMSYYYWITKEFSSYFFLPWITNWKELSWYNYKNYQIKFNFK